jgi:acetamidase/formamidase
MKSSDRGSRSTSAAWTETIGPGSVQVYKPSRDDWVFTFGGVDWRWRIQPGEVFEVFTEDCFCGRLRTAADLPSRCIEYPFVNPQTGPFYIEGAEPGDTLAVHLLSLEPARDWAVSTTVPLFGALTSSKYSPTLQNPLPETTWIYRVDMAAGAVRFAARDSDYQVNLRLEPFHGTIGVAPAANEVRTAIVPEAFGGNMDTPEARAGATLYFGVNEPGALLSLGDGHYRMGDGEVCGVAVEGAMRTRLVAEVLKGVYCEWPRIEDDSFVMVAGSYRPLDDAYRIAHTELVRWVASETGLSLMDSYQLISQTSQPRIANVCDPNYTVVARVPKSVLPEAPWMSGAHARLQARQPRAAGDLNVATASSKHEGDLT